ncbi:hypothetical protein BDF20DRAFT_50163 [Mycotypha africana]|uniref:uncharacterized protein n=1 Tax=Mycotypha africana TaxID=64632 RepID=UPI0023001715|nr:uncharacterized protein BDF20DRAFT_50163 [Mycotypha africana]KAI8991561.1 hypothetical protein BDF20DRAFT_50163 [Mycotypha africana]
MIQPMLFNHAYCNKQPSYFVKERELRKLSDSLSLNTNNHRKKKPKLTVDTSLCPGGPLFLTKLSTNHFKHRIDLSHNSDHYLILLTYLPSTRLFKALQAMYIHTILFYQLQKEHNYIISFNIYLISLITKVDKYLDSLFSVFATLFINVMLQRLPQHNINCYLYQKRFFQHNMFFLTVRLNNSFYWIKYLMTCELVMPLAHWVCSGQFQWLYRTKNPFKRQKGKKKRKRKREKVTVK